MIDTATIEKILAFRRERDWEQFHTPKNLAISISLEASELLELFQWAKESELENVVIEKRPQIQDEVADILVYVLFLCHDLQIDIDQVIQAKMIKNAQKYPIEKARGNARKYDEYERK